MMIKESGSVSFAPQLYIPPGVRALDFYLKAFGAVELRQWTNDDGSLHVAELTIGDALFHVHEEAPEKESFSPLKSNGTTVVIGLFVSDVHGMMAAALAAGATEISPVQDYDYGYRQGRIKDPFGHHWLIEMKI